VEVTVETEVVGSWATAPRGSEKARRESATVEIEKRIVNVVVSLFVLERAMDVR